jgi:hypothetical protein
MIDLIKDLIKKVGLDTSAHYQKIVVKVPNQPEALCLTTEGFKTR